MQTSNNMVTISFYYLFATHRIEMDNMEIKELILDAMNSSNFFSHLISKIAALLSCFETSLKVGYHMIEYLLLSQIWRIFPSQIIYGLEGHGTSVCPAFCNLTDTGSIATHFHYKVSFLIFFILNGLSEERNVRQ